MFGGVQAVTWADVKQMVVIMVGVTAAVAVLIAGLPDDVGIDSALHVAGATGRLQTIDFTFDLNETYTFWSGLVGGLFLMLGYFGCDQSQVQRYLTARSVDAGRYSLMMSAFAKIPLQMLILLTGVLMFVFYLFNQPPMLFNSAHDAEVQTSERAAEYAALDEQFGQAYATRRQAADDVVQARRSGDTAQEASAVRTFLDRDRQVVDLRERAVGLVRDVTGDGAYADINYVFPTFVTTQLPIGLVGLMIAAIFAAAMSSIAAELNALSAATVIDFYRRHYRQSASDRHYLRVSKVATGFWGVFRVNYGFVRRKPRVFDRGRQPVRIVLLRLAPWCLRPRCWSPARDRGRCVLGSGRWNAGGGRRGYHHLDFVSLAESGRDRRGVRGGEPRHHQLVARAASPPPLSPR